MFCLITYIPFQSHRCIFGCNSFRCRRFTSRNLLNDCTFRCCCFDAWKQKSRHSDNANSNNNSTSSKWHLRVFGNVETSQVILSFWLFKLRIRMPERHARVLIKPLKKHRCNRRTNTHTDRQSSTKKTGNSFKILNLWHVTIVFFLLLFVALNWWLWAFLNFALFSAFPDISFFIFLFLFWKSQDLKVILHYYFFLSDDSMVRLVRCTVGSIDWQCIPLHSTAEEEKNCGSLNLVAILPNFS